MNTMKYELNTLMFIIKWRGQGGGGGGSPGEKGQEERGWEAGFLRWQELGENK